MSPRIPKDLIEEIWSDFLRVETPVMTKDEVVTDIAVWGELIAEDESGDAGVSRRAVVKRLEGIASTARKLRYLIRPDTPNDLSDEAEARLMAFAGSPDMFPIVEDYILSIEALERVAIIAANLARIKQGKKPGDAWDSPVAKREALTLLMTMWRDWTGKKLLSNHFKATAEILMQQAFRVAEIANFDRIYKESLSGINRNPGDYRILWRRKDGA